MMAIRKPSVPHVPVLIAPLVAAVAPVAGHWVDGTYGAGGYTRALLDAGANTVTAIDRDPLAFELAPPGPQVRAVRDVFSNLDAHVDAVDGVVLDLGVSSMQLDRAERGFSFMRDGPLDMRMSQEGPSAADLIAGATEAELADILYVFGEERASRRIARAIKAAWPIASTLALAEVIERQLPRPKPGQSHPATRSFQALRIAVNGEYEELYRGLMAAERALRPGGALAVVSFHSVEDRMVKRFMAARAGASGNANRYAPVTETVPAAFSLVTRKAIQPSEAEVEGNPRARSALLRIARRTDAPPGEIDARTIGLPLLGGHR